MNLIGLLIGLIIICAVFWAARALLTAFAIGDPIATVVYVLLVIIVLAWVLSQVGAVGGLGGGGTLRVH
jgi:hypothetical protein